MEAEYTAVKSAFSKFSFLLCFVLLLLFIVPGVIYVICKIITAKHCTVEFYADKYIVKSGVFNTRGDEVIFKGVLSVTSRESLRGKIFGFGDVTADMPGRKNLYLEGVKNPEALKRYLQGRRIEAKNVDHMILD